MVSSLPGAVAETDISSSEVSIPSGSATVNAYLARSNQETPAPAIILLHEAFGLNDHIRDVARRLAGAGFTTLAPDLYSREGAPDPTDIENVMSKMLSRPDDEVVTDLENCATFLRERSDVSGQIGCIGFCSGGRQALLFATSSSALDAVVDCWGGFVDRAEPDHITTAARPVPVVDLVENLSCPALAVGGEEDTNPSPAVLESLAEQARKYDKNLTVRIFAGAGHAFFADYRPSFRPEPAHALWRELIDFFTEHLQPKRS